jgi:acetyl-CoA synthetase
MSSEDALHISYNELHQRLQNGKCITKRITKGDRVCIYLPMIPN